MPERTRAINPEENPFDFIWDLAANQGLKSWEVPGLRITIDTDLVPSEEEFFIDVTLRSTESGEVEEKYFLDKEGVYDGHFKMPSIIGLDMSLVDNYSLSHQQVAENRRLRAVKLAQFLQHNLVRATKD